MISYGEEFEKELKKLSKKYNSLKEDFVDFELVLSGYIRKNYEYYLEIGSLGLIIPEIEGIQNKTPFKIKKFICISLAGRSKNSGIRVIYVVDNKEKAIHFLEIYGKADKTNHNVQRLKDYLNTFK